MADGQGGPQGQQESLLGESQRPKDSYVPPRTRQRIYKAPPPLAVPDIEEDADERKRVLNVLAQRRYRERKRQKKKKGGDVTEVSSSTQSNSPPAGASSSSGSSSYNPASQSPPAPLAAKETSADDFAEFIDVSQRGDLDEDFSGIPSWSGMSVATCHGMFTTALVSSLQVPNLALDGGEGGGGGGATDFSASQHAFSAGIDPLSLCLLDSGSSPGSSTSGLSADSYLLPVNELTILRAILRISSRLGCDESFWQLEATSPFYAGTCPPTEQLPECWRPTPSQMLVAHHPFIDFLPWPGVRERMLAVMSLPPEARPPNASSPLALVEFAYDVEDSREGMRIWGDDVYDPGSWEVGQVLFERWWFIFDRDVIENSNRWRRLRGAAPLRMQATSPTR